MKLKKRKIINEDMFRNYFQYQNASYLVNNLFQVDKNKSK